MKTLKIKKHIIPHEEAEEYKSIREIMDNWDFFPGSLDEYNSCSGIENEVIKLAGNPTNLVYLCSKNRLEVGEWRVRYSEPQDIESYHKLINEGCSGLIKSNQIKRSLLRRSIEAIDRTFNTRDYGGGIKIICGIPVRPKDNTLLKQKIREYKAIFDKYDGCFKH